MLCDWFVRQQQIFGDDTYEISVPSLPPGVVISSTANLEFVLKNEATITKGPFFKARSWDLFGYGIINASGALWKAQRKAGLKFFSGDNLDLLVSDVLPDAYIKAHKALIEHTKDDTTLDLQKFFLDLTTTTVGHIAYSMTISSTSPFSRAFDHASDHVALRFQNPLYRLTEVFTGTDFRTSLQEVKAFGRAIVANAKARRSHAAYDSLITNDPEPDQTNTLIDALISAFDSDAIVADSAMNFLSAGRDTTAQSLTWTFYALLRHPQVLPKLRAEIESVFPNLQTQGPDSSQPIITLAQLQPSQIPYTMAVYYESLRLYPPVPIEIKQTLTATTLPDGTYLPSHAIVVWVIWALNRRPSLYPDPEVFRPERWLDDTGKFVRRSDYEFPVFNGGPRGCLGRRMAEVMGCWVIVTLVSEFEFEEVAGTEEKGVNGNENEKEEKVSQNSLTLPMKDGLVVRVRLRTSEQEV